MPHMFRIEKGRVEKSLHTYTASDLTQGHYVNSESNTVLLRRELFSVAYSEGCRTYEVQPMLSACFDCLVSHACISNGSQADFTSP